MEKGDLMVSKYGERQFLMSLCMLLTKSEKITDDNGNEFNVIPSETTTEIIETLHVVINRMDGPLFEDED